MSVLSRLSIEWARRCFGAEHVNNPQVRALRTVEEAIELCQAFDVPKEKVQTALDTVYSRPQGEPRQEIGGVLLTVAVLCESRGWEPDSLLEMELARVLEKPMEHFKKRNREKCKMGLDIK